MSWLETLTGHARDATSSVLLTVTSVRGSAPREPGAKMVVTAGGQDHTIGGGSLEYECVRVARELLRLGTAHPVSQNFPLGPALGQCCGGHVTVLFEPMLPPAWQVVVYGAGHVGQALVGVLASLPCRVAWVDGRAALFPGRTPDNVRCVVGDPLEFQPPPHAMVLVMTHDHALDYELVRACLPRRDLRYVGLIGSATKRARFNGRLARDGVPDWCAQRLVCPIGVAGANGKLPAEIAVAVAAQLLQVRDDPMAEQDAAPVAGFVAAEPRDCAAECAGCAVTVR